MHQAAIAIDLVFTKGRTKKHLNIATVRFGTTDGRTIVEAHKPKSKDLQISAAIGQGELITSKKLV